MNYRKTLLIASCILLMAGCVKAPQNETQTLVGLQRTQVFIAAQHTLAAEGYKIEEMNAENGSLKTAWQNNAQGQVQFQVQVSDKEGAGISAVELTVSASARKKTLNGWSEPLPTATADTKPVLNKIVEKAIKAPVSAESMTPTPKFPVCQNTSQCVAGTHCASGMCVSECSADADCASGNSCDPQGRCVPQPPPPCPVVQAAEEVRKSDEGKKKRGGDK